MRGVPPGSSEETLLLDAVSGSVRQFYLASAQNKSLGIVSQTAKGVDRGTHQIRYIASQGDEIVTVTVHPEFAKKVLAGAHDWWDWAVIDLVYITESTSGEASAYMVIPRLAPLLEDVPNLGVALDNRGYYDWDNGAVFGEKPILAFPDRENTPSSGVTTAELKFSLRVDLRPFRGLPAAAVDLWAYVTPIAALVEDDVVESNLWAVEGPNYNLSTLTRSGNKLVMFRNPAPNSEANIKFPELAGYGSNWYANGAAPTGGTAPNPQPDWTGITAPYFVSLDASGNWSNPNIPTSVAEHSGVDTTEYWAPGIIKKRTVETTRFISGADGSIIDNALPTVEGSYQYGPATATYYYYPIHTYVLEQQYIPAPTDRDWETRCQL